MLRALPLIALLAAVGCVEETPSPTPHTTHTKEVTVIKEQAAPKPAPQAEKTGVGFAVEADEDGASVDVSTKEGSASIDVNK
ncbi:MAG: hypothetical protein EP330_14915 [Deltaproteobacteria bacterium]|nr:MAG: hypothetical protein EP330_14915 [Deltaproteobacteria bacterium]